MTDLVLSPAQRRALEAVARGDGYLLTLEAWDKIRGYVILDAETREMVVTEAGRRALEET